MSVSAIPVVRKLNRNIVVAGSVVLFHLAALWALQTGLLRRTAQIFIPVEILSEIVEPPPPPKVEPPPVPKPPEPVKQPPVKKKVERALPPPPKPVAIPDPKPAPNAPIGVIEPQPPAPPITATVDPEGRGRGTAPGPGKVELPSSDASYLQNPAPAYPAISKRLGEQGKVVVRVLIGADGAPQRAEVKRSSGYDRLDRSAIDYVMTCRYVPGKVGGVPQAMWYEAPVNYVLE
ncbi:MAG TPA: energy transducer TonB [Ramlibacter sp.]|nr:energy transducer TonB [Ramlibacter sp.]